MIKIALYGNVCNNFFSLAASLRQSGGFETHLYLNNEIDFQHQPESDDPSVKDNPPSWIHRSNTWNPFNFLKRRDYSFIEELEKYDLVMLSDYGPVLSPYIKKPTIFYSTGMDLTRIPFQERYAKGDWTFRQKMFRRYTSWMQARGIRRCTKIFSQPFRPFATALDRLKIPEKNISKNYYPILIDTDIIKYRADAKSFIDHSILKSLENFEFIIFHPSRLFINKTKIGVETGTWKGNDKLIEGFSILVKTYNKKDACLALPERRFSPDIENAKKLISELGIEKNVIWLKPTAAEGFTRHEMVNLYSISDVVADEFATGWFGSIVVEGAACSKPVLSYVDQKVMKSLYPSNPIISMITPTEIASTLNELYISKLYRTEIGETSRRWAETYHSTKNGAKIYANNLKIDLNSISNFKKISI